MEENEDESKILNDTLKGLTQSSSRELLSKYFIIKILDLMTEEQLERVESIARNLYEEFARDMKTVEDKWRKEQVHEKDIN